MGNNKESNHFVFYLDDEDDVIYNKGKRKYHTIEKSKQLFDELFNMYFVNEFIAKELDSINKFNPNGLNFHYRYTFTYTKIDGDFGKYKSVYCFSIHNITFSVYSLSNCEYVVAEMFIKKMLNCNFDISREMIKNKDTIIFSFCVTKEQLENVYNMFKSKGKEII